MDFADGDSAAGDLIDKGIPIYQRGITGEQALQSRYLKGEVHKYFSTNYGGRYIDVFDNRIAHEAKAGYTCLSSTVKKQVLKDAWLL